jgi:hypothetical protein
MTRQAIRLRQNMRRSAYGDQTRKNRLRYYHPVLHAFLATAENASSSVFQRKYQVRGNNAAWAGPFNLLRGGVSAQLRGNVDSLAKELNKSRT